DLRGRLPLHLPDDLRAHRRGGATERDITDAVVFDPGDDALPHIEINPEYEIVVAILQLREERVAALPGRIGPLRAIVGLLRVTAAVVLAQDAVHVIPARSDEELLAVAVLLQLQLETEIVDRAAVRADEIPRQRAQVVKQDRRLLVRIRIHRHSALL